MRSHVKVVKSQGLAHKGDYAVSMEFLDETNWCPTLICSDDDVTCEIPYKSASECHGDYCAVHLPLSDFADKDLANARFSGSDLSCANFRNARLQNADFTNTDLCQATLVSADLREANFSEADLSFADLSYSDLRGANLSGTRYVDINLKGAKFDRHTQLPISRDEAELRGMKYCF